MRDWADYTEETDATGGRVIALVGPMVVAGVGPLDARLRAIEGPVAAVDLSRVTGIDTVGAWIAARLAERLGAKVTGASDEARRLVAAVSANGHEAVTPPEVLPLPQRVSAAVGELVLSRRAGLFAILDFVGALLIATWDTVRNPRKFRGKALVRQLELTGVNALGIIGLMSFLVGIVIAQQGAVQLQDLGFGEMTVNLTGRISMRELGILMTAIMVAGRSGSAFAAQIGTMKLTEEVDAMRTIGVSPMQALVLPRVLAAMLMMPLLGFYSAVIAIIGGAFISTITLDIPFFAFLLRVRDVVPMHDVWVGLVKGPFFGFIVALAGCYQGMQVQGNSEEVGLRTTTAVVQAIFMVIVLDAFFAVFFTEVGWG